MFLALSNKWKRYAYKRNPVWVVKKLVALVAYKSLEQGYQWNIAYRRVTVELPKDSFYMRGYPKWGILNSFLTDPGQSKQVFAAAQAILAEMRKDGFVENRHSWYPLSAPVGFSWELDEDNCELEALDYASYLDIQERAKIRTPSDV